MRWEVSDPPPPPRRPHLDADAPALRVLSWNVNGVRALLEKDPDILDRIAEEESADVVVLQETKLQAKMVPEMDARVLEKYPHRVWNCATSRLGYSGVAMFCRSTPTSTWSDPFVVDGFEGEGRVVAFELDRAFVVGAYVPNSGDGLKRLDARVNAWDPAMAAYLRELESRGKPVVFCGDLNVARAEMDLWGRHRENARAPGFTPEERESFASLLVGDRTGGGLGMVDTFRHTHPSAAAACGGAIAEARGIKTEDGGSITCWCRRNWERGGSARGVHQGGRGRVGSLSRGGGFVGSVRTRAQKNDTGTRAKRHIRGFATVPERERSSRSIRATRGGFLSASGRVRRAASAWRRRLAPTRAIGLPCGNSRYIFSEESRPGTLFGCDRPS